MTANRMKTPLVVTALLVAIAGGALVLVNFAFDHTKVKTYAVAGQVREIVVKSDSGDVDLVPATAQVAVRETQHYVFEKPSLDQDVKNGVLALESHCTANVIRCYADLRVAVPAGVKVTVEADSGNVDAHAIDVRDAHVQSDSGNVRLELAGRQPLVWAHTDSGNVDVVAADARAIDARTDSGNVAVDAAGNPRRVLAHTDSGNVEVHVPADEYAVDAETDSGDVKLDGISRNDRAPRSIQARTDSGNIALAAR